MNSDGTVRNPGLDNHGMGSIFEELIRRFNEENNEEAGEHWTPTGRRDAHGQTFCSSPSPTRLNPAPNLLYDGACGTGGMLTVAEETLRKLAAEKGKDVSTHLYGQEINAETYAICKADLLLKGEGDAADNIVGGPEHSTLANDAFPSREFDFMLSNPPYGKSWKTDLERMGGKADMRDPRFVIEHVGQPRIFLGDPLKRWPDALSRQPALQDEAAHPPRQPHRRGSQRQLPIHRRRRAGREQYPTLDHRERLAGSHCRPAPPTCSTTPASPPTSGSSPTANPRTAGAKCSSLTPPSGTGPSSKNLGKKNCELGEDDINRICDTFLDFKGNRAKQDLRQRRPSATGR